MAGIICKHEFTDQSNCLTRRFQGDLLWMGEGGGVGEFNVLFVFNSVSINRRVQRNMIQSLIEWQDSSVNMCLLNTAAV